MNAAAQNSSSISETLIIRKAHLAALFKIIDTKIGKSTAMQILTINAIKTEIGYIDNRLKNRN